MGRIKVRYLNVYYELTGKKEESIDFAHTLTVGELLERVIQSGGPRFKETILDDSNRLKPHVWLLANRTLVKDLGRELQDGDMVVFSLTPVGG
jgi:molybdopterin converting factor small subunit